MEGKSFTENVFISLLEFGFSDEQAREAAIRFDNLEEASNWIVAREETISDAFSTTGAVAGDSSGGDSDDVWEDEAPVAGGGGMADSAETDFSMFSEELKMVLCVRTDLKMTKGKIAAQCVHAALGACRDAMANKKTNAILKFWTMTGEKTVALQCDSEKSMMELQELAKQSGLVCHICCDAGRTQVEAGSFTVLAIGPAKKSQIDAITGTLKLL
jgi:peptidyl-tRNA hydrolase, PTH2 family